MAAGECSVFSVRNKDRIYELVRISSIGIKRHIKVRADANPYLPEFSHYFWKRRNIKECRLMGELSFHLERKRKKEVLSSGSFTETAFGNA